MAKERTAIDWEETKRRLRTSELALEAALNVTPERLEAVYQQRAAELARRVSQEDANASAMRVLAFLLGEELYALELADVVELLPFAGVTPVPEGPPALLGVINLHEEICSVVDLGHLMELADRNTTQSGYVMVVRKKGQQTALRVDALDAIHSLRAEDLLPPGEEPGTCRFVRAVTRQQIQVLSTETILAHPLFGKA